MQDIKDDNDYIVESLSLIEELEKKIEQALKISAIQGQDLYRTSSRPGLVNSQYAYGTPQFSKTYETPPQTEASINSNNTPQWINAMSLQPGQKTMLKQSFRDYTSKESKPIRWSV